MTKRTCKKFLALLLAMMMVIGLFPAAAVAAEPEGITAYITVSVAGSIPKGTNGDSIAQVPVRVTDHNNNQVFDVDDALFALHEAYYPSGASVGYSSESGTYGLGITKLWGNTSGTYGYWVNNAFANSLEDTVSAGAYITAFVYADSANWSDSYAKFDDFTKIAAAGKPITLRLQAPLFDTSGMLWSNLEGASIYVIADGNNPVVLAETKALGEADVVFPAVGTYYITASKAGTIIVPPICKITVTDEGDSGPSANDTKLSALPLTFLGDAVSNGLPYVGTSGINVGNAVQSVALAATARASEATITVTYQDADDTEASVYHLGGSVSLAVGANTFKLTVTNGADTQIHTLVVTRKAEGARDIPSEVAAVINGVKTVTGGEPYTDWILAMNAAGLSPTDAQRQTYLAAVLVEVNKFVDGDPEVMVWKSATMAKIAIALTSLGIDARQIPDPDGGEAIDLVKAVAAYDMTTNPVYGAPFLLSLYDLGNYEIPVGALSTRLALIEAILGAEKDWTAWGYDGVGMVLPALAPYYNAKVPRNGIDLPKCNAITAAVNRALASLSAAQTIDGGFGKTNSNTVSTVITGLNAVGINSDHQFIKSGTSLLMNLLSFRTSDGKLGKDSSSSADTYSGLQGFQALATWQNLSNARNSNLYHFTKEIAPYTSWPSAQLLTGIAVTTPPTKKAYSLGTVGSAPDTTGIVVTATYNADAANKKAINIADCTVSAIDCTTAGTKTVTVTYQGKSATFLVTVLDENGTVPKQNTVSVVIENGSKIIARDSAVVIQAGATSALDVLKTVLNNSGKTYVIRNGSYVAEIDGLGELDKGANSGWLYSVNGVTPSTTAANDYSVSDGDTVRWYYTQDYTSDASSSNWTKPAESDTLAPSSVITNGAAIASVSAADVTSAIAAVKKSNSTELIIEPKMTGTAKQLAVALQKASLTDISTRTTADLRVQTPVGSLTIPNGVLGSIASQAAGSTVTVALASVDHASLTAAQREAASGKSVFDISIVSGSNQIRSFGNGNITISLPYALKSGEDASDVSVWYLDSAGKLQKMTATYDQTKGLATFKTPHLSHYVVGYAAPWSNAFSDVQSTDWFYGAVKYATQKGLFNGKAASTFAPNEPMTRAMLVTVLFRLEGKPTVTGTSGFGDVQSGQWYTDAVTWASINQIVTGYGGGRYGTDDPITREQMAAILYRYAQYKDYDVTKTVDIKSYTDATNISTWAKDAMTWANAEGLISGTTAATLSPADKATRAQVATILMRFVEI